tara:strand:- start:1012 stop:1680 length:669 start_codon:yes stop_codon:yes gene_type:complete
MSTPLWIDKISILYEKKYLFEIIPNKHFDFNRKLNSLLRLSIYYAVIIYLMDKKKANMFYIPFIVSIVTYILSRRYKETFYDKVTTDLMNDDTNNYLTTEELVKNLKGDCNIPTKNNPFMNPEIYNYNTKNVEESACTSYNNKGIQSYTDELFSSSLIRDVTDLFGKNNSQRQFYTVPGNSIPNNQDKFAKWLYATPKTCKEGNGLQCAANIYGVSKGPLGD